MPELPGNALIVSDSHIRGDPGCDGALRVELWEQPKPARQRLGRIERLLSHGRRPPQPPEDAEPRVLGRASL